MKYNYLILIAFILFAVDVYAQNTFDAMKWKIEKPTAISLESDNIKNKQQIHWHRMGSIYYEVSEDSLTTFHGKHTLRVSAVNENCLTTPSTNFVGDSKRQDTNDL
ncbi:MAG: hypothetical protein FWG20_03165 [Candidatus Cloacimonetes bacterium]|nr:hypothetical protein [Candidatus Cloacimonadota bacterium]